MDRPAKTRPDPLFFAKSSEFRAWLEKNHDKASEIWVGFHKKDSGKPSITWPEAVDQALCFGWIDSVRRRVNDTSYANRFTTRKARSTWSAINIRRAKELISLGRMQPAGIKAFERRSQFRANKKAWKFFRAQAPWYQRVAAFWVVSAKKDDTRLKRLAKLIKDSENGRTIPPLTRPQRTE